MDEPRTILVPITKLDDEQRMFGGWAYVARDRDGEIVEDHSGDVVDTPEAWESLKKAFVEYALDGRMGDEMHEQFGVSRLVELFISDEERWEQLGIPAGTLPTGVFVSYRTDDEDVWAKVKGGDYTRLSIVGWGEREAVDA